MSDLAMSHTNVLLGENFPSEFEIARLLSECLHLCKQSKKKSELKALNDIFSDYFNHLQYCLSKLQEIHQEIARRDTGSFWRHLLGKGKPRLELLWTKQLYETEVHKCVAKIKSLYNLLSITTSSLVVISEFQEQHRYEDELEAREEWEEKDAYEEYTRGSVYI